MLVYTPYYNQWNIMEFVDLLIIFNFAWQVVENLSMYKSKRHLISTSGYVVIQHISYLGSNMIK